ASIVKAIYEGVSGGSSPKDNANLSKAISDLKKNKGKSLLVSGSNDLDVQMVLEKLALSFGLEPPLTPS
ncbi:MAG: hypothetical protein RID18_10230, partial [Cytophagales bacterium]